MFRIILTLLQPHRRHFLLPAILQLSQEDVPVAELVWHLVMRIVIGVVVALLPLTGAQIMQTRSRAPLVPNQTHYIVGVDISRPEIYVFAH